MMNCESSQKDLHLFVIWEKSRPHEEKILADISAKLIIHSKSEVEWSKIHQRENYARFYNRPPLERGAIDEKKGGGRFLAVVAEDPNPYYLLTRESSFDRIEAASNVFKQNQNVLATKKVIREYTSKYGVHSSTNSEEFRHQLVLLFGPEVAWRVIASPNFLSNREDIIFFDCAGSSGWQSLGDLFSALNLTTGYAVIRKTESFIDEPISTLKDIDIVVQDAVTFSNIVGGKSRDHHPAAAKFDVTVKNQLIFFHLQQVGNGYLDPCWQREILSTCSGSAVRTASPELNFFAEIYQKLVYKKSWTESSLQRLVEFGSLLGYDNLICKKISEDRAFAVSLLANWMIRQGFVATFSQEKPPKSVSKRTIGEIEHHYPRQLDLIRFKRSFAWKARILKRKLTDEPQETSRMIKKMTHRLVKRLFSS